MVDGLGLHAAYDTKFVGNGRKVRQHLTQFDATLTMLLERVDRATNLFFLSSRHARLPLTFKEVRTELLAVKVFQFRFVVQ